MTDPQPGRTHKAEWIAALASRPKAKRVLCESRADADPAMCCLGVLAAADDALLVGADFDLWLPEADIGDADFRGEGWYSIDSDYVENLYVSHPTLDRVVQALFAGVNDCTDTFDDLVVPFIEVLLEDDLSLKAEHQPFPWDRHRQIMSMHPGQTDEMQTARRGLYADTLRRLREGASLVEALPDL